MWVYMKSIEDHNYIYTVGYYYPHHYAAEGTTVPKWHAIKDFKDEWGARQLVHYLNGGQMDDAAN